MKQVREVAYDAEDCIDTFWHHHGHRRFDHNLIVGWLHKITRPRKTLKAMHKLAIKIRDIKARALKVSERRLRYKVEASFGGASDAYAANRSSPNYDDLDRWLPALNIDESRLVGMSEKTKSFIELLDDGNLACLRVVPIVGSGGLGKTTLAMNVYNTPEVKGIQTRAFLAVSQHYDLHILLESLLRQLIPIPLGVLSSSEEETIEDPLKGIETWDISQFIGRCITHLKDKRYFIVLDDMWSPKDWVILKVAFPDNDKQSRILITTRNLNVAESCCSGPHDLVYRMKPLPFEESKKLFYKRVFKSDTCPPPYHDLEVISDSILKRCSGLPLAIVCIGGILARTNNKTKAEWEKLCDRLGSGLETNPTLGGMRRILSLGYHDLPYYLKACFLYLSVMLEVITSKSIQENFISFMGSRQYNPTGHDKIRRLSIHTHLSGNDKEQDEDADDPYINFSHTRSLLILGCCKKPLPITFAHLKLLRVASG